MLLAPEALQPSGGKRKTGKENGDSGNSTNSLPLHAAVPLFRRENWKREIRAALRDDRRADR